MARATTDDPKVVTASRLTDGAVVWLDARHHWATDIAHAAVWNSPESVAAALAAGGASAARQEVVEPYAVDVAVDPAIPRPQPLKMRERVRAGGPTVLAVPTAALPVREVA